MCVLLSEAQVAERFGFSRRTLQNWRQTGLGPVYVKAPKRIYYRLSDIENFIEANLRRSTSVAVSDASARGAI